MDVVASAAAFIQLCKDDYERSTREVKSHLSKVKMSSVSLSLSLSRSLFLVIQAFRIFVVEQTRFYPLKKS